MSTPETAKTDSLVGQLIDGRYLVSREIAVGGMGVVYEAKHVKIGRSVAIKVLHREMAGDTEVVGRFLNEARAMGTIGHPNIVACTDFGELPGHLPYLVLEYLDGRNLGDEIATVGPLPVVRALRIGLQVASALEAAHSRGVIHRDLTSGNVFLTKTEGDWDHAKVLDFGISKFLTATEASPKTRRGFTMGTPEFMAPEQITHPDVVDARVDVYSLGVILYHMLAGKPPFGGVAVQTLFLQVVNELPPHIERTDIPPEVLAMLDSALAKNPEDRFANMKEMGAELEMLAPPPMSSGNYSGRIELPAGGAAARPATGSRPISRTLTSRTPGGKSGVYPAASRTSLVDMATRARNPEQPPQSSRRLMVVIALAMVAAVSIAGFLAGRRHDDASTKAVAVAPGASTAAAPAAARPAPEVPVRLKVSSATTTARVTFRGRAHQLPFSEEVAPDSKLELVEITAPGHEGRRFWLSIDHPMQLSVDLPGGRGVIEATTEEALIALGERPSEGAPPATDPSWDATELAGKHGASSSHRPGARLKTAVAVATATSTFAGKKGISVGGSAPTTGSPEPTAPPATSVSNAPKPTPAAEPPAAVGAPPKASPESPPSTAAAPAPKPQIPAAHSAAASATHAGAATAAPSAPAAATAGSHTPAPTGGTIDAAQAQQVFAAHDVDVQRCHQRAKIDNSDVKGRLAMRIGISPSGQVTTATVESSTLRSRALETCIATAVKGWPFPAAVAGPTSIAHVFVLR